VAERPAGKERHISVYAPEDALGRRNASRLESGESVRLFSTINLLLRPELEMNCSILCIRNQ